MSKAQSLLVKYEWNPAWQEKWGLSPGDTKQCACVLCMLWSNTRQRPASHSAPIGRHTIFHKWAPVLAGEWQATGSVRIWEHGRALTASAKPGDAPLKLLLCNATHSVPTGARLASKDEGACSRTIPLTKIQFNSIQFICIAQFHKLLICLGVLYNLYT